MSRVVFQNLASPMADTTSGLCQLYAKTDGRLWMKNGTDPETPISSLTDHVIQNNIVNLAMRHAQLTGLEEVELETGVVHSFSQSSLSGLDLTASGTYYDHSALGTNALGANLGCIGAPTGNDLYVCSDALTTPNTAYLCTLMIFANTNSVSTVALNTEIKGALSRDGGSTFTDVTLEHKGNWGTGSWPIYVARDVSMSASTTLKYKLHIDQGTSYQIHGAAMSYRDNG